MSRTSHDPRRRRLLLLAAAPWALAGCTLGSGPRRDFYPLRDAHAQAAAAPGPGIDKVLLIASGAMPGLYDSDRMVFSADGRSRSYFQFGYWSERPAQSLLLLAEARLVSAQRFRTVASSTSGVRGDLLLSLRLEELYLDASLNPGQVRLAVAAELVDWRERKLVARRSFRQSMEVSPRDAPDLALAGSQAAGALLDELVAWVVASAAALPG
jgi:cholesterol transport system auxiliary component